MVKIIIQKPDETVVMHPEYIDIKRNSKSETVYKMVEKMESLSKKKEPR